MSLLRLAPDDNVAVALVPLVTGQGAEGLAVQDDIPRGHKMALETIPAGAPVRKYAQLIGYAQANIAQGAHVHTHNVAFRNTDVAYEFATDLRPAPQITPDSFMGYRRANGMVGTRNYIGVLTSVNCSATAARRIAAHFTPERLAPYPHIDGVVAYVHGTGCGMGSAEGLEALHRVMWGYARHPNHAGVLMVGLGCETNQTDWLLEAMGITPGPLFQVMNIQSAGLQNTIEAGIERVAAMLPLANEARREPCPASALSVALQCGGSDAWSGITANPALGYACDLLVGQGGIGLLAETPEIYGAEHLLTRRAESPQIAERLIGRIRWWEDYTARNHGSMDNNPSPGNKAGGLTTILEKSLGAAVKGGTTPLVDVLKYAEPLRIPGFCFMDSPGYDPASVTGQIASGCTLVAFTTGRGSAFGSKPAPTIKIATNDELAARMPGDMDINAGPVLSEGVSLEQMGRKIYAHLLKVASGEITKSEAQGLGDDEFVPWMIGAVM